MVRVPVLVEEHGGNRACFFQRHTVPNQMPRWAAAFEPAMIAGRRGQSIAHGQAMIRTAEAKMKAAATALWLCAAKKLPQPVVDVGWPIPARVPPTAADSATATTTGTKTC